MSDGRSQFKVRVVRKWKGGLSWVSSLITGARSDFPPWPYPMPWCWPPFLDYAGRIPEDSLLCLACDESFPEEGQMRR